MENSKLAILTGIFIIMSGSVVAYTDFIEVPNHKIVHVLSVGSPLNFSSSFVLEKMQKEDMYYYSIATLEKDINVSGYYGTEIYYFYPTGFNRLILGERHEKGHS